MDVRELLRDVTKLISEKRFLEAEQKLLSARGALTSNTDLQEQGYILSELITLYCIAKPTDAAKVERLSLEREALWKDAASRLQTAMMLFYSLHSYERAATKAGEAIELGRVQGDSSTVYTALCLLGKSLLQLNRLSEAPAVLDEIETMISEEMRIVIGDEASFFEALREQHIDDGRVARLASVLGPRCQNPVFRKKLDGLAGVHPSCE